MIRAMATSRTRDEREREEAVGDRAAERRLLLGALDVHVDPLVITGQVGELVDHLLGDLDRWSPLPELAGRECVDPVDVVELDGHLSPLGSRGAASVGNEEGAVATDRYPGRRIQPMGLTGFDISFAGRTCDPSCSDS